MYVSLVWGSQANKYCRQSKSTAAHPSILKASKQKQKKSDSNAKYEYTQLHF